VTTGADSFADSPPRQLIVTLYGLYARDEHNWLPIAGVVRLMRELGIDEQSVRSSISRLKRRDTLRSVRLDGVAGYALSPTLLDLLRAGDRRIFDPRPARLTDGWVQVIFTVPEAERDRRHELRSRLAGLGLGPLAPGVWVAPGPLAEEVCGTLERQQLGGYVDIFRGVHLGFAALSDRVRQWWDLEDLAAQYAQFVSRYRPLALRVARESQQPSAGADAFTDYVRMLTVWRRLRYRDPGLAAEVLPPRWIGIEAASVFTTLDALLRPAARRYAMRRIRD
jgi:phenylacetic acid degradation operon negative regulatory protein